MLSLCITVFKRSCIIRRQSSNFGRMKEVFYTAQPIYWASMPRHSNRPLERNEFLFFEGETINCNHVTCLHIRSFRNGDKVHRPVMFSQEGHSLVQSTGNGVKHWNEVQVQKKKTQQTGSTPIIAGVQEVVLKCSEKLLDDSGPDHLGRLSLRMLWSSTTTCL